MDFSLKQALGVVVWLIVCSLVIVAFGNMLSSTGASADDATVKEESFFKSEVNEEITGKTAPVLTVEEIHLQVNQEFNLNDLVVYARSVDAQDGDISSNVTVAGKIDITRAGSYPIRFTVYNSVGLKTTYIKSVLVD